VAGNGNYLVWITTQALGSGSAYVSAQFTLAALSGQTALQFPSIILMVLNTDVLKVYIQGLAGDTTTPDSDVQIGELSYLRSTVAGRTLDVASTGEVGLDFTNRLDTTGILPAVAAGGASGLALVGSAMAVPTDQAVNVTKWNGGTVSTPAVTGEPVVTLGATQAAYAPAKAGDVMGKSPATLAAADVSGNLPANLTQILGAAITGTAAQIVAAFSKFFDKASPTGTVNSLPDAVPGNASGLPLKSDLPAAAPSAATNASTLLATVAAGAAGTVGAALADTAALGDPWTAARRTLTSTAAATQAAMAGSKLVMTAGAGFSATLTGFTIPATWTAVIFTAKSNLDLPDSRSVLQVRVSNPPALADGLLYLAGAVAADADGAALTVTQATGDITLDVTAATLAQLGVMSVAYDLKLLRSDGEPAQLTEDMLEVRLAATKAIQ
jgi:hypothetical protein